MAKQLKYQDCNYIAVNLKMKSSNSNKTSSDSEMSRCLLFFKELWTQDKIQLVQLLYVKLQIILKIPNTKDRIKPNFFGVEINVKVGQHYKFWRWAQNQSLKLNIK